MPQSALPPQVETRRFSLVDLFCQAAGTVGAQVERLRADQLQEWVRQFVLTSDRVSIAASLRLHLGSALDEFVANDHAPNAVGLADGAIARTGTVIVAEALSDDRLPHMLAHRHVVVVPADRIVPDIQDSDAILDRAIARGTSHITYITGPSRTSDIEKVLTIGVHGPEHLILLVVEPEDANAH